jgi:hypothetical protein
LSPKSFLFSNLVIRKINNDWTEKDIAADKEVQVGYYHIRANDMNEAIKIAKDNPEFEYVPSASIEVRPIKTKETAAYDMPFVTTRSISMRR